MKKWSEMSDMEQVYLFWEWSAAHEGDEYTFSEFDDIMRETEGE